MQKFILGTNTLAYFVFSLAIKKEHFTASTCLPEWSLLWDSTVIVTIPAFPINIRLGWKWMAASNTPAYYNTAKNIALKNYSTSPRWSPGQTLYKHVGYSIFFKKCFHNNGFREFHFQFWLWWFSIINNLIIIQYIMI